MISRGFVLADPAAGTPAPGWRFARRAFARWRSRATTSCSLAGLAVPGVPPAPLAVLAKRDAIRVVALGLIRLVVPALALLAGEGHSDPDVSAGHLTACSESRGERRAKENPAPARGRTKRIALSRGGARTVQGR